MDIRSLDIDHEASERKYNPKFLLIAYVNYFKKLKVRFKLDPGERNAYNKEFADFLAQEDKLLDALDVNRVKKIVKITQQQLRDIQKGKQPRKQDEYNKLTEEFSEKSDYLLNFKADDGRRFSDLVKTWWQINKKKVVKRTVWASWWFDFLTKAFSFLLARFVVLGIKDPMVSFFAIKSGKIYADIIASVLIFLLIDKFVEKIKTHFLWERVKFMHGRLLDLDNYLKKNHPDLHAELEQGQN
jgi:hypothetical protein